MASVVSDRFFVQQISKAIPNSTEFNPMASSQYHFDDVDYQYNEEPGGFTSDGQQFNNSNRQHEDVRQPIQPNDGNMQNHQQGTLQAFQEMQRQKAVNSFQPQMSGQFQSVVQNFGLGYMNAPSTMGMNFDQNQKNNFAMNQLASQFQQPPNLFYGNIEQQQQGMFLAQQNFNNQLNPLWMSAQANQCQNSIIPQGMTMNANYQTALAGSNFMGDFSEQMATTNNVSNEQGAGDLSFQRLLHRNISGLVKGVSERNGQSASFNEEIFNRGVAHGGTKDLKPPFLLYPADNQIESRGILLTKPSDEPDDIPAIARPKRPLTAYNLFFKEERANIVEEQAAENEHHTSDGVKRTRRKEPHGKIGFEAMAKTIAERWKTIDPDRLAAYNQRADEGKKQYRKAIAEFNRKRKAAQKKRQQESASAPASGISQTTK